MSEDEFKPPYSQLVVIQSVLEEFGFSIVFLARKKFILF
jgi:hypothetical protein